MQRFKYSMLAAAGLLILAFVLTAIGPKRVMAALGYTPVRDVDNAGRHPFQFEFVHIFGDGQSSSVRNLLIPRGKRLVIDYVIVDSNLPPGQIPTFFVGTTSAGVFINHTFLADLHGPNGFGQDDYYSDHPAVLYQDGDSDLRSTVFRNGSSGSGAARIDISGHMLDLP